MSRWNSQKVDRIVDVEISDRVWHETVPDVIAPDNRGI